MNECYPSCRSGCLLTSVEVREHPELEGKPVVVGSDPKEGKEEALLAVPLMMKPGNPALDQPCSYQELGSYVQIVFILDPTSTSIYPASNSMMKILRSHVDKFEQDGIDEAS